MTETPAGRSLPPSRYGRAPMSATARRRVVIGLATLVVLAGLGVAFLGYQRFEGKDVEGKAVAYSVSDDRTVSVTISVTRKDPARPVVCIARARSSDGAETGRREILVGPSEAKTVQVTTTVASYRRPASGDVYGCGTKVPGYLAP